MYVPISIELLHSQRVLEYRPPKRSLYIRPKQVTTVIEINGNTKFHSAKITKD